MLSIIFDLILHYWTIFKSLLITKQLSVHKKKQMVTNVLLYSLGGTEDNVYNCYVEIFRHTFLYLLKPYTLYWRLAKLNACIYITSSYITCYLKRAHVYPLYEC